MVHFIENLLSTSADRGLYEALWLVSTSKRNSNINYETISVQDICSGLIEQWRQREKSRENFFISTQLAFGALYVYKFQIDKFYDQAQTALRLCRLELFDANWLNQMSQKHSTPNSSQSKSQTKKIATQKKDNNQQSQLQSSSLNEDFDSIEEFFKVLDDDLPAPLSHSKKKGKSLENDSGIDPTMATNSKCITILEPDTMMSSGFHSSLNLANDYDAFGDENDFQRLLIETDEVGTTQENLMSSDLLSQTPYSKRKSMNHNASLKKRRLTYEVFENDIENAPVGLPFNPDGELLLDDIQNINVSSFDQNSNGTQETFTTPQLQEENIEMIVDPTPSPMKEVQANLIVKVVESQLVLEDISNDSLPNKKRKYNRKLIVDKLIEYDFATLQKNPDKYMTTIRKTPFLEYNSSSYLDLRKSSVDMLFTNPSSTLKNGSAVLRNLFERNLKKIPLSLSKKRKHMEIDENDSENVTENKNAKKVKSMRPRNVLKDLNQTNMIVEEMDLEFQAAVTNTKDFNEIQIPPMDEFIENILPPAIELNLFNDENSQVRCRRRRSDEGEKLSKEEILFKLKKLWKEKDQSITMEKLTEGLSRITVAGVFFELLVLSKLGVIELIHKQNSLEIGHIECIM